MLIVYSRGEIAGKKWEVDVEENINMLLFTKPENVL
jgi:hypothetical protein